jgi:hypothetical protein
MERSRERQASRSAEARQVHTARQQAMTTAGRGTLGGAGRVGLGGRLAAGARSAGAGITRGVMGRMMPLLAAATSIGMVQRVGRMGQPDPGSGMMGQAMEASIRGFDQRRSWFGRLGTSVGRMLGMEYGSVREMRATGNELDARVHLAQARAQRPAEARGAVLHGGIEDDMVFVPSSDAATKQWRVQMAHMDAAHMAAMRVHMDAEKTMRREGAQAIPLALP